MCTSVLAQSILEVIQVKTGNGEVFTAFDITVAVRKGEKDSGVSVPHNDIQRILGNEFDTGQLVGYSRELITLDVLPSKPQAFVFYPDTKSADEHDLVLVSGQSSPASSVSSPASTVNTSTVNTDGSYTVSVTAEGRINIPKKALDQVSPTGNSYDFSVNGSIKCRCLTGEGRIRFSMNELGFSGFDKCKISVDTSNNSIVLETA